MNKEYSEESTSVKPRSKVVVEEETLSMQQPIEKEMKKQVGRRKKQVTEESTETNDDIVPVDSLIEETLTEAQTSSSTRKPRVMVTKDSVVEEGNMILSLVEEELERLGDNKEQSTKFLRQLQKKLKTYNTNVSKVVKKKEPVKRVSNSNSGFLKKVLVSDDVINFTGWSKNDLYSRTDVTRFICAYIKEHNLQNKDNGRFIHPDKKLGSLLRFDMSNSEGIRYCDIQKMIKPHFQNPQ